MKLDPKKCILVGLCSSLLAVTMVGCKGVGKKQAASAGVQTILIGHHYQPEDDPYWVDEITGESEMSEDDRRAAIAALDTVKEKLGVDIKWVSYPSDIKQCVLQTVLANDPVCHIPIMANGSQGTLLSQNVLQELSPYKDVFESDPDYDWVLLDKCFGGYYLMNRDFLFMNNWPLVYNATYIERIPSLKENGKTIYPATLYEEGRWTWSEFRNYLEKIRTGINFKAANGNDVYPFHTNYTYTMLFAFHSNGACLYDGQNLTFDSPEGIAAGMYLTELIRDGLCNVLSASKSTSTAGYMAPTDAFINGESVFNNIARWKMGQASSVMAERGESMGVIPFPRPDDICPPDTYNKDGEDDPYRKYDPYEDYDPENEHGGRSGRYQIYSSVADSVGLLKGFDAEESRLAIEAYCMYRSEYYKHLAGVDSVEEYINQAAVTNAVKDGVDIFHPEIGDANLRIYKQLGSVPENEFGESVEVFWDFAYSTFGNSVWGVNGASDYSNYVKERGNGPANKIKSISEALNSGDVKDTILPNVGMASGQALVFPVGSDPKKLDWTGYFTVTDDVDGTFEFKNSKGKILVRGSNEVKLAEEKAHEEDYMAEPEDVPFVEGRFSIDYSGVDFNTVGEYTDAVKIVASDKAGNKREATYTAFIYDKDNTNPPKMELKKNEDGSLAELKTINLDAKTDEINWGNDYIGSATDENGIDIKSRVKADVSYLDVTVEGEYPVVLYVEDFAGNRTEIPVTLTVKKS